MTSKPIRAIVVGGTGYTGAELVRLALGHPSLELVSIVGNTTAGQAVGAVLPSLQGVVDGVLDMVAEGLGRVETAGGGGRCYDPAVVAEAECDLTEVG